MPEKNEEVENVITEVRQSAVYPSGQAPEKVQVGLVPGESVEYSVESKTVVGQEPEVPPQTPTPQPDEGDDDDEDGNDDDEPEARTHPALRAPAPPQKKK